MGSCQNYQNFFGVLDYEFHVFSLRILTFLFHFYRQEILISFLSGWEGNIYVSKLELTISARNLAVNLVRSGGNWFALF